ncbi:31804_t:CDS:1, partial [Gigaspora margarita]
NEIPIPTGITLRDTLNNINETLLVISGIGSFFISWIADYLLFQNGVEICALKKNQKQQSIEAVD